MNQHSPLKPLVAGLILAMAGTTSLAQSNSNLVLEEVLVTATKREQSLQDVAVAVTALSADLLQEAQINSSEDLTFMVPSLNLQKGGESRTTSFSIRGIGTQSFSAAAEPSVSTMLDGVVMGRSGQSFMQLLDVQRVEVLRGPQGTLFGKNSTGGVVHIITENPTEEHSGELMGTIINDEEYRAGLTVSGPITDDLGFRITANGADMAGYTKNYYDGDYLNGLEEWSVRGKLRWFPVETVELKWASDYSDSSCDCVASPIRSLEPYGGNEDDVQEILDRIAPVVPGEENDEVNINRLPFSNSESWGHSLEANWDIGEFTLTSITAVRGYEVDGAGDPDSQPIDSFGFLQGGATEQEQFTQELRILSPADGRITYVAGLFYFDQTLERQHTRRFEIIADNPGNAVADFEVDTENWAAFGEATWAISDTWRLIVGARYTEDELGYVFERVNTGPGVGLPDPVEKTGNSTDEDNLSGKLALQWDYNDVGMTYLSYTQGYKGPAFDVAFSVPDPANVPRVEPETSDSWELGLKTSMFDGQVRLNAALFHSVYEDFQSQAFFDPDGVPPLCPDDDPNCNAGDEPGSFILINAGEVTTQGLELDFLAQVTENFRLSGGIAFIDAKIDDYPAGQCSGGQKFRGECPDGLQDLSGGELPFSPDWKGNLTASYVLPMQGSFDMVFKGMVRAQDDVLFSLTQDENTVQDSYAILDASVNLESHSERWNATFFVKNLTDEFYVNSIQPNQPTLLPNGYNHRYSKLAGRTYGLELRYRWF